MIRRLLLLAFVTLLFVAAYGGKADQFQCVSGNNVWKNDSGGAYTAPSGYIISAIWVKAGQNCYELPHACYAIAAGGVGYDYVEVVDAGGCQELSHLEGTYATVASPTVFPGPTSPPETEVTPTTTATYTPEPTATPPITPTEPPITPYPTKECQIDHCGGLG